MVAASQRLKLCQCDISTAFLYGRLEKPVYLESPEGHEKKKEKQKYGKVILQSMDSSKAQEYGTRI